MDATVFHCPNCGAPVDIDYKTRKGTCEFCGSVVTFPRKTFNSSSNVVNELPICLRSFDEKRFADARAHAESVLAVAIDNGPALYARTYYEAFAAVTRNSERLGEFFKQINDIDMDGEEVQALKKMFLSTVNKLGDYEEELLQWAVANLAPSELGNFTEAVSPLLIGKRTSIDFFTPKLAKTYKEIASLCPIPKTCYALLQAITNNPDSPYPENQFFLKTKTKRFHDEFVLPVGEIIQSMDSPELKNKFYRAYQARLNDMEKQMKGDK